jgi:hypothetical protein
MRVTIMWGFLLGLMGLLAAPLAAKDVDLAKATQERRAALPPPTPAIRIAYEGDLAREGHKTGSVSISVRAQKFAGKSLWHVRQDFEGDAEGERIRIKASYHLAQDLSLHGGTYEAEIRGSRSVLTFLRNAEGQLSVTRSLTPWHGKAKMTTHTLDVPADATFGTAATLLLVRGLDASKAPSFRLPVLPLHQLAWAPETGDGSIADVRIPKRVIDVTLAKDGEHMHVAVAPGATEGAPPIELLMDKAGKSLLKRSQGGAENRYTWTWVPKDSAKPRRVLPEEEESTKWEIAFRKFGYAYHMARPDLIAQAFHWPTWFAHEKALSADWKDKSVDDFRDAWVAEFMAASLNRPRADTKQLIDGTLGSGKAQRIGDDKIVFKAHPQFGGGVQRTYHLQKFDGRWYITRIE